MPTDLREPRRSRASVALCHRGVRHSAEEKVKVYEATAVDPLRHRSIWDQAPGRSCPGRLVLLWPSSSPWCLIPWAVHAQSDPTTPPSNLTAEIVDGGVLSWGAPIEYAKSVTGYDVLRRRPYQGEDTVLTYVADSGFTSTASTDTDPIEPGERGTVTESRGCAAARRAAELNYAKVDIPDADQEPTPTAMPPPTPQPRGEEPPSASQNLTPVVNEDSSAILR